MFINSNQLGQFTLDDKDNAHIKVGDLEDEYVYQDQIGFHVE